MKEIAQTDLMSLISVIGDFALAHKDAADALKEIAMALHSIATELHHVSPSLAGDDTNASIAGALERS